MYLILRAYNNDEDCNWATIGITEIDDKYLELLKERRNVLLNLFHPKPDKIGYFEDRITFFKHDDLEETHPKEFQILETIFEEEGCFLFKDIPDVLKGICDGEEVIELPRTDSQVQSWYAITPDHTSWQASMKYNSSILSTVDFNINELSDDGITWEEAEAWA